MAQDYALLVSMLNMLWDRRDTLDEWTQNFVGDVKMNRDFSIRQQRAIKQCWFRYATDEEKYQLAVSKSEPDWQIKRDAEPGPSRTGQLEETEAKTTSPDVAVSELIKRNRPNFMKRGTKR